ncbi:putative F-box only protein 15 [Primulina huaijiensis]|uniref:putative F-box only protein 15 n=1 Tax=Primulina huaijiensis TaxID=1492673 RepID=UPI003CC78B7F
MASSSSPSSLFVVQKHNPQSNHLPADGNDLRKPKTEVTGFNSVSITSCIYHCCKRCARKRQRRKYLPLEIFSKVLLHLPAQVLHDAARYVCRDWNLVIRSQNFIYNHLEDSNSGLIIQGPGSLKKTFVEMRQGCLEISKFDFGFDDLVTSSCNGLVLTTDVSNLHILIVVNPVTKQRLSLPPFFRPLYFADFCGFAFVVPSMEYKVVTSYGSTFGNIQCAVLTIGVDQVWRQIDIQHLSLTTRKALWSLPLTTGAFVHWIYEAVVLTLNMETETIHQFSRPPVGLIYGNFLPMENNLTYVCVANDFLWEVWEMNLETGVWNKSFSFDLGIQVSRYKDFFWFAEEFSSLWLVST